MVSQILFYHNIPNKYPEHLTLKVLFAAIAVVNFHCAVLFVAIAAMMFTPVNAIRGYSRFFSYELAVISTNGKGGFERK